MAKFEWTEESKAIAIRMYVKKKMSLRAIGVALGRPHSTIQKLMEIEGVIRTKKQHVKVGGEWRKPFRLTNRIITKALFLYHQKGWTFERIQEKKGWPAWKLEEHFCTKGWTKTYHQTNKIKAIDKTNIAIQKYINLHFLDRNEYRDTCTRMGDIMWRWHRKHIDPKNRRKFMKYEIDHKLSVMEGFESGIPIAIINHPANLRVIPTKVNNDKAEQSILTFRQLLEGIIKYDKENGSPFKIQRRFN